MTSYNLEGLYKGKKIRNLIFRTWKESKERVMSEIEPFDYYGIKQRYTDLKIVESD